MSITITWNDNDGVRSESVDSGYSPTYALMRKLREIDVTIMSGDVYQSRLQTAKLEQVSSTRGDIIEWWKSQMGTRENDLAVLNSLLSSLDMHKYTNKWQVDVDYHGSYVMSVVIEANDAVHAEELVMENIHASEDYVKIPVKYTGIGEVLTESPELEVPTDWVMDMCDFWSCSVFEYVEE